MVLRGNLLASVGTNETWPLGKYGRLNALQLECHLTAREGYSGELQRFQGQPQAKAGTMVGEMPALAGYCCVRHKKKILRPRPSGGVLPLRRQRQRQSDKGENLLGGNILILNAAIDEAGQLVGRLLDVSRLLGDGELLEELIKDLEGLSVLGRHDVGNRGVLRCKKIESIMRRRGKKTEL